MYGLTAIAVTFAIVALLFAIGGWTVTRPRVPELYAPYDPSSEDWTASLEPGGALDAAARVEIVQRLALIGEPWCAELLRAAAKTERDPHVAEAIAAALRTP